MQENIKQGNVALKNKESHNKNIEPLQELERIDETAHFVTVNLRLGLT